MSARKVLAALLIALGLVAAGTAVAASAHPAGVTASDESWYHA
jgi:hypothetical protein